MSHRRRARPAYVRDIGGWGSPPYREARVREQITTDRQRPARLRRLRGGRHSGPRARVPVRLRELSRTGRRSARAGLRGVTSARCSRRTSRRRPRRPAARRARPAPSSSTPASCSPTRGALRRFDEHEVVLPGRGDHRARGQAAPPRAGLLRPHGAAACSTSCGSRTAGSTSRSRSATTAAPSGSSSTTPTPTSLPVRLPARRQRHPDPRGRAQPRRRGPRRHAGLQGPAAAGQGVRGRPRRRGVPRRARRRLRLDRHGRARRDRRRARRAVRRRRRRPRRRPASCPATPGWCCSPTAAAALGRVGADKQVRLVRGDREAFGLHGRSRRAADRPGPAARPRGRHRLARRPRRHRQVRAGAVRRPRGGAGAPPAPARSSSSGRCSPSVARSSATCPAPSPRRCRPGRQAVFDTLGALTSREVIDEVLDRGMLEVLPLTHIRGRSLHDAFVIVDEAQSLERNVLLTVLSRIGPGLQGGAHPRRRPARQPAGRAGTTASSRWSRSSRATRCSPTSR